jgi:uncharacterized FlaG/YvyC family protein
MDISSIKPSGYSVPPAPAVPREEIVQRRALVHAAKAINASDLLGQNQLVIMVDPTTHRAVMRVEDRDTHEVLLQLPPEAGLRLAQDLATGSSQTSLPSADT